MKTIIKKINSLEIEDIEKAVSDYIGEARSINNMRCSLIYYLSGDYKPKGMRFVLYFVSIRNSKVVNGTLCPQRWAVSSYDLFYDKEKKGHYLNGKQLSLDEPWLPISEVFNFDTSAFEAFTSHIEWYD